MKRLNYIDGLKGWCAVSVCILHFQLMFVINGYMCNKVSGLLLKQTQ